MISHVDAARYTLPQSNFEVAFNLQVFCIVEEGTATISSKLFTSLPSAPFSQRISAFAVINAKATRSAYRMAVRMLRAACACRNVPLLLLHHLYVNAGVFVQITYIIRSINRIHCISFGHMK